MKARPLGWWDSERPMRTHTRRCANQRTKIIGLLSALQEHPDHGKIAEFVHQVLNLAADKSALGQEGVSKELQKRLTRALNKLSVGELSAVQALKELQP